MSHYIERFCEKHGTWDQDVDHPHDECPTCEEAGMAPSQVAAKELTDLRARLAAAEAERDQVRADAASQLKAMQTIIDTMEGSVREVAAERDALRLERDRMAVNRMWMRLCDLHRRDLIPEGPCVACDAERRLESNVALRAEVARLRASEKTWQECAEDRGREVAALRAALCELVRLKRLKDSLPPGSRDDPAGWHDYTTNQPKAWEAALKVLADHAPEGRAWDLREGDEQ